MDIVQLLFYKRVGFQLLWLVILSPKLILLILVVLLSRRFKQPEHPILSTFMITIIYGINNSTRCVFLEIPEDIT